MRFKLGAELAYQVTGSSALILNIEAARTSAVDIVKEQFGVSPAVLSESHEAADTGNRYRRLILSEGKHCVRYEAEVEFTAAHTDPSNVAEVPVEKLPLDVIGFLNPSRYCQSDRLARFAYRQFGDVQPGFNRVTQLCNWIFEHIDYVALSSNTDTTALDTFTDRNGVCRDFAHLGISFCRALGIPARFVSAYAFQLQPPDFHAVFEAYLGDRWYVFDATRRANLDGIIRIGQGRDAADAAFSSMFGAMTPLPMCVWIESGDGTESIGDWPVDAVSVG